MNPQLFFLLAQETVTAVPSALSLAQYGVLGIVCVVMMYAVRQLFLGSNAERKELLATAAAERAGAVKEHKSERDEWAAAHREERAEWRGEYKQLADTHSSHIERLLQTVEKAVEASKKDGG